LKIGHRFFAEGQSTGMSMVKESGTGIVTINNGTVTNQIGLGTSTSLTRSQQSGSSFEEQKSENSYTASSGESNSRAMSTDTSYSTTSGVGDKSRTNSIGSGMQMAQVESSGSSIAETFDAENGSSSRAISSGNSRAMQMGTSSGSTRQGEDGNTSNMIVTTLANATSDGKSQVTQNQWVGDSRMTSTVNNSTTSRSNENFTGTVNTDAENRTSRNGTAKSDANVTAKGDFTQRNNYVGGAFPNTEVVTGDWNNTLDFKSNGEIDADHDRVKRMGEAKAKNDNKENVTVDFTGGNGLTHDSETGFNTWHLVMTITDTRLTDDSERSSKFNETEDISKDKETVNPESENPVTVSNDDDSEKDGEESSSSNDPGKLTDKTKITVDTWNSQWYDEAENNKDFKRSHDHTVTTDTTRGGENSTTTTTKVEWTKDSKSRTTQPNLDVTRSKSHEEGTHTKTFTTEGNEKDDKQTLKITRTVEGESKDTTYHSLAGDYNIAHKTIVKAEWDENSHYEASHKLAADGQSAKDGKLTADHTANHTKTTTKTGRHYSVTGMATITKRLDEKGIVKTNLKQNESFDYKDTSEGRILDGSGTSKETTTVTDENSYYKDTDYVDGDMRHRYIYHDRHPDPYSNDPDRQETVNENTQTVEIKAGKETVTNAFVSSGSQVWYDQQDVYERPNAEYTHLDYTIHIEERKDWKHGNLPEGEDPFDDQTLHVWGDSDVDSSNTPTFAYSPEHQHNQENLPFLSGRSDEFEDWIDDENVVEVTYYDGEGEGGSPKKWDLHWDINAPPPPKPPVVPYTGSARGTGEIDTPDTRLEGALWGVTYGGLEIVNSMTKLVSFGYANLDETAKNLGDFAGVDEATQQITRRVSNSTAVVASLAAAPAVATWAGGTSVGGAVLGTRAAQMAGGVLGSGYTQGVLAGAGAVGTGYHGYHAIQAARNGNTVAAVDHALSSVETGLGTVMGLQALRKPPVQTKPPAPNKPPAPVLTEIDDVPSIIAPDHRTGSGYGVNDPPVRIQGPWTEADYKAALRGSPPPSLESPDLHHAGQMPGSPIHEIVPGAHRGNSALHPNRFNQGVTPQMRMQDRQLHWWYRAREMGADQLYPDLIYK
jgi:hypothetical protein